MKKVITLLMLAVMSNLMAQSSEKDDIAILQGIYGKDKTEIVNAFLELPAAEKAAFQPVYDSDEEERKALGREKIKIIDDYAVNYHKMTEEKADELAKALLKNNLAFEKLYGKTYTKAKKVLGAIKATKFIQVEIYLQTMIRFEIQDAIPFIDNLEDMELEDLGQLYY